MLREHSGQGVSDLGSGRLGGFVVPGSARTWSGLSGLTCRHVFDVMAIDADHTVGEPRVVMARSAACLPAVMSDIIARGEGEGHSGPHLFAWPGEVLQEFYIDCATFRLRDAGLRASGPAQHTGAARAHPCDIRPGRGLPVRLFGVHGCPVGRITDVAATVEQADGTVCRNTLVIESLPGGAPFAVPGDSGALVVDAHGRAVGLLWGVDLGAPRRAFACHLMPVLDRLGVVLSRAGRLEGPADAEGQV